MWSQKEIERIKSTDFWTPSSVSCVPFRQKKDLYDWTIIKGWPATTWLIALINLAIEKHWPYKTTRTQLAPTPETAIGFRFILCGQSLHRSTRSWSNFRWTISGQWSLQNKNEKLLGKYQSFSFHQERTSSLVYFSGHNGTAIDTKLVQRRYTH